MQMGICDLSSSQLWNEENVSFAPFAKPEISESTRQNEATDFPEKNPKKWTLFAWLIPGLLKIQAQVTLLEGIAWALHPNTVV